MSEPRAGRLGRAKIAGAFVLVAVVTFLCFAPCLGNAFVVTWDDAAFVVDNTAIRELSVETLRAAFLGFRSPFWAPLTWLSFALDYAAWGLDPFGYHLTNTVLHALNAGLVFLIVLRLLRPPRGPGEPSGSPAAEGASGSALRTAMLAALLFAIHPLRVESVAWVSERKDVLSLFFGLAAVLAYLRHVGAAGRRASGSSAPATFAGSWSYWLAVGLYCLSLLSKATLVTLPVALLVLDWQPLRRLTRASWPALVSEKVPLALMAAAKTIFVMSANSAAAMPLSESDRLSRVLIAIRAIAEYLRFMAWPVGLSPFHLHPGHVRLASLEYALPVALVLGVTCTCLFSVRRRPVFMAVWLLYLVTVAPTLGSAQISSTFMADRYTYVPAIPVAVLIALGVTAVQARAASSRAAGWVVSSAVAAVLLALGLMTVRQIGYWKDDVTLWSRAIDLRPHHSGRVYSMRATAYEARGDVRNALLDLDEAVAIALARKRPFMHDLYLRRARLSMKAGALEKAIADYGRALEADGSPMRAVYLRERGTAYREMGRQDLADLDLEAAAQVR